MEKQPFSPRKPGAKPLFLIFLLVIMSMLVSGCIADPESALPGPSAPGVTLTVGEGDDPKEVTTGVQLFVLLTVLTLAPSILILATSFTRVVIVLSMLRSAIGTPSIPPNQVMIGLSLLVTFFIMAPIYQKVDAQAIQPYLKEQIDQETAFKRAVEPVREFMLAQTREKDIELFMQLGKYPRPTTIEDIPTVALFPAFVISELRIAFTMGFVIYIPFLIIDLVVSSVLLSMGMMMLPPSLVSLPFKLLLFVMVDGWYLIIRSLAMSFGLGS